MTTVKDRILQFIENQGFNKEHFFENVGLSYSNFKGIQKKSGLNSDAIVKILSFYPQINLYWLILGKGEMLLEKNEQIVGFVKEPLTVYNLKEENSEVVEILKQTVADLKRDKEMLYSLLQSKQGKAKTG